jgi:hypothetical protein
MRKFLIGLQVEPSQKVCVELLQQARNVMFQTGALRHWAPCTKFLPMSLPTESMVKRPSSLGKVII